MTSAMWCAIALILAAALVSGVAAIFWVLGGGVVGYLLGTEARAVYERVHQHDA